MAVFYELHFLTSLTSTKRERNQSMAANNLDCRNGGTDSSDMAQEPSGYEPDELPLLHPAMCERENLTTYPRHVKRREYMPAYQLNLLAARRRRYLSDKRCK